MVIDGFTEIEKRKLIVKVKLKNGYDYTGPITFVSDPNAKGDRLIYLLDKKQIRNYDSHHHKSCIVSFLDREVVSITLPRSDNFFHQLNARQGQISNPLTLVDHPLFVSSGLPSDNSHKIKPRGKKR